MLSKSTAIIVFAAVIVCLQNQTSCVWPFTPQARTQEELNRDLENALYKKDVEGVKQAIVAGADVNATRWVGGMTMLGKAVLQGTLEIVRILIDHGAAVNKPESDFDTPLNLAAMSGNLPMMQLLIEHGAHIDPIDDWGKTPLFHTCINNRLDIARLLLEHGADVNARDYKSNTPLHFAISHARNSKLVELLVQHGADVYARNNDGLTSLELARYVGATEIAAYLYKITQQQKKELFKPQFESWLKQWQTLLSKPQKPEELVSGMTGHIELFHIGTMWRDDPVQVTEVLAQAAEGLADAKTKGVFGQEADKLYQSVIKFITSEIEKFLPPNLQSVTGGNRMKAAAHRLGKIAGLESVPLTIDRFIMNSKNSLMSTFYENLEALQENQNAKNPVIETYNTLRRLSGQPEIHAIEDIDYRWLDVIDQEIYDALVEQQVTISSQQLINDAKRVLRIKQKIQAEVQENEDAGFASKRQGRDVIGIGCGKSIDEKLMTIYHELGHIEHGDTTRSVNSAQQAREVLNQADWKHDLANYNQLVELGKKAYDQSTELGKYVNDTLKHYSNRSSWDAPLDKNERTIKGVRRAEEKRAELFALQSAFNQHQLAPILARIYRMRNGNVIAATDAVHPSNFESLLYQAGFLVKQGFDLNGLLREWEKSGTCISADMVYMKGHRLPSSLPSEEYFWKFRTSAIPSKDIKKIEHDYKQYSLIEKLYRQVDQLVAMEADKSWWAQTKRALPFETEEKKLQADILKEYEELSGKKIEKVAEVNRTLVDKKSQELLSDYERFKDVKKEESLLRHETLEQQKHALAKTMQEYFERLQRKPDDQILQLFVVDHYNFLRELNGLPTAKTIKDIDHAWLSKEQTYERFKEINKWTSAEGLRSELKKYLDVLQDEPDDKYYQEEALWHYNFLREQSGKSLAKTVKQIDHAWAEKNAVFEIFKKRKQDEWMKLKMTVEQQKAELMTTVKGNLDSSHGRELALLNYNLLRELAGQRLVDSFEKIDRDWLNKQETYELFKEEQRQKWAIHGMNPFLQKIKLFDYVWDHLDSTDPDIQRQTLWHYNMLRELFNLSQAAIFQQIDQKWVMEYPMKLVKDASEKEEADDIRRLDRCIGTKLMCASKYGNVKNIKDALEGVQDINIKNEWGSTPLMRAASGASPENVRFILDHGANPDIQDNEGKTALHDVGRDSASSIMTYWIVRVLLEYKANPNIQDHDGNTPLHRMFGDLSIAKLLIEHGARRDIKNKKGETPVDLARQYASDIKGRVDQKSRDLEWLSKLETVIAYFEAVVKEREAKKAKA